VSLAESSGAVCCDTCGQEAAWGLLFLHPPASFFAGADVFSALCAACYYKKREPGGLVLWQARNWRLAGTAEERFEALLEAARVFWRALKDRSPHEVEEIFPTLSLAHKIGDQGRGMYGYRGVRFSDVLEGMPILERTTLYVSSPETSLSAPSRSFVVIQIGAHGKAIAAEEIAETYRGSLEAAGEVWGGKGGSITYGFHGDSLQVEVIRGAYSTQDDGSLWPSPPTVGRAVKGILEEFAGELQLRERGPEMKRENLVPGMTAHLLRGTLLNSPFTTKAGKTDRQEIQRLLESRVFCVEPKTIDPSRWRQIWGDMDKGAAKMENLFSPPPMRLAVFRRA
jgi:hypothetical protein